MSEKSEIVSGRVVVIQFAPRYPSWASILLDRRDSDGTGEQFDITPETRITVDGSAVDVVGLNEWANTPPSQGRFQYAMVEMEIDRHSYVPVKRASFTAVEGSQLESSDPQQPARAFWSYYRLRVLPRLDPTNPPREGSAVLAVEVAKSRLGENDPAVVKLIELYSALKLVAVSNLMN